MPVRGSCPVGHAVCVESLPAIPPPSALARDLSDFRVQSYEATEKWFAVVFLALAFLQWRLNHAPSEERLRSLADVVRQHRYEHTRTLLETACQEAVRLADYVPVLQRFLYAPT